MKVWISLFVVLCFAGIARAQVPAEYPFMPLDNPAYADLKTWSGKDTNSYCCFSDPVKNPCQMTRYEFAVQVTRAISSYEIPSGKQKQGRSDYEIYARNLIQGKTSRELSALARLVAEFKPEVKQLGISDEQIQFTQNELEIGIKANSDVPVNNQAYADFDFLEGDSFRCYPAPPLDQRIAMTRYEFAVAVAVLCRFSSNLNDPLSQRKSHYEPAIHNALSRMNQKQFAAAARLFTEFKSELRQLGVPDEQTQFAQNELAARTGSTPNPKPPIAAPFRDVPKTHWAFNAVERLRQSGIVIGNPDGAFAK